MTQLEGKRVLVVGLARTGLAVARFLQGRGAVVTVTDAKPPSAFQDIVAELAAQKIGLELGAQREETFLRHELIVVSPGVPWDLPQLLAAREKGVRVIAEIELASWFLKGRLVGITGTNGKTTTTALLGKILEASGLPTFVGGNIGVPLIAAVNEVPAETILVTELSSFQLEAIDTFRPHVAVLLNITPNHLDRHASFEDYRRAKARIFINQQAQDYAVLNADDSTVMNLAPDIVAPRKIFFSRQKNLADGISVSNGRIRYRIHHLERVLLETREVPLRGEFNLENVLAAAAAACVLGADFEAIRRAVREFQGVEHRLELVGEMHGVEFYNDSKATSVDAAAKALSAFSRGVHLILGGKDKGAPYTPLRALLEGRVRSVYLIGAAAERIAHDLAGAADLVQAGDLETATREAFMRAAKGDTVLLSPACASFDQFDDYEHRGRAFKQIVEQMAREMERGETGRREASKGEQRITKVTEAERREAEAPEPKLPEMEEPERREIQAARSAPATPEEPPPVAPLVSAEPPQSPNAVAGDSDEPKQNPLDRIYVYEYAAEEMAPAENLEAPAEWADEEVSESGFSTVAPEVTPEVRADDPMPFEVPVTRSSVAAQGGAGPQASAAGTQNTKAKLRRGSRKNQGRVPGT